MARDDLRLVPRIARYRYAALRVDTSALVGIDADLGMALAVASSVSARLGVAVHVYDRLAVWEEETEAA